MAVFNGTNLGVYVGSTIIAAATDCSLSLNMDTIDITTKDSAGYRELLAGLRSGFLTSLEQSGGTEDTATYSASFELSGVVTPATIA